MKRIFDYLISRATFIHCDINYHDVNIKYYYVLCTCCHLVTVYYYGYVPIYSARTEKLTIVRVHITIVYVMHYRFSVLVVYIETLPRDFGMDDSIKSVF